MNNADTLASFRKAMETGLGAAPEVVCPDGSIHRFATAEDRCGQLSGWYVLFSGDLPAGSFGDWRTGRVEKWSAVDWHRVSPEQRSQQARRMQDIARRLATERRRKQRDAALRAWRLWSQAPAADPKHPYLQSKQVAPCGLRQHRDCLLVPMEDERGFVNLQTIRRDGTKRFLAGGKVKGAYSPIMATTPGPIFLCEGWATGATIHTRTGRTVVCAMNSGNLGSVAVMLRRRFPCRPLTVAGDDDRFTEGNPGRVAAVQAARLIGAECCFPPFPDHLPGTDFNDFFLLEHEGRL